MVRTDLVTGPADVTLEAVDPDVPEKRKMTGQVVDEKGNPVFGASVWLAGFLRDEMRITGPVEGADKVAFTDEQGRFLLTSSIPYEGWKLTVSARGFAKAESDKWLPTGDRNHEIRVEEGVLASGYVKRNGKPVPGYVVSICHGFGTGIIKNGVRGGQIMGTNERRIATDENGRFEFTNLMPEYEWLVYPDESNDSGAGYPVAESFDSPASGKSIELGDFELLTAGAIRGRVVMASGRPVPGDLALSVSLEFGRLSRQVPVAADGSFVVEDLPQDQFVLTVFRKNSRQQNYRLTPAGQQLQNSNRANSLALRLDGELNDLKLLVEVEGDLGDAR